MHGNTESECSEKRTICGTYLEWQLHHTHQMRRRDLVRLTFAFHTSGYTPRTTEILVVLILNVRIQQIGYIHVPGVEQGGVAGQDDVHRNGIFGEARLASAEACDVQIDVVSAVSRPLWRLLTVTEKEKISTG